MKLTNLFLHFLYIKSNYNENSIKYNQILASKRKIDKCTEAKCGYKLADLITDTLFLF